MFETSSTCQTPIFDVEHAKEHLHQQDLAVRMFYAPGKQSFHLENLTIQNLYDLKAALDRIPSDEALRLADWIRYLGDDALAQEIYKAPEDFKKLILMRYAYLTACVGNVRGALHQR